MSAGFFGLAVLALVKAARALKGTPLASAHAAVGPWIAALTVALVFMLAAQLPRPKRGGAAMAWVMALSTLGLSRLIGAMNNWRGGWQVGPRYLVTLVPVLAITALAGLEALRGEREGARARVATVFAGGATVAALAITALPSAWFPHIPTEFGAPLFEMMMPLLRGGHVPHNAGHLAHLSGHLSMAGFYLGALGVLWVLAKGDEKRPAAAVAHAAGVLAVALLLLVPQALAYRAESAGPTRYVLGAFEPPLPATTPASLAPPPRESPAQAAARARRLAAHGEQAAAMQAWLRSIRGDVAPGR
jgi:hypothetical protein